MHHSKEKLTDDLGNDVIGDHVPALKVTAHFPNVRSDDINDNAMEDFTDELLKLGQ